LKERGVYAASREIVDDGNHSSVLPREP
jgi:hypothetical protein